MEGWMAWENSWRWRGGKQQEGYWPTTVMMHRDGGVNGGCKGRYGSEEMGVAWQQAMGSNGDGAAVVEEGKGWQLKGMMDSGRLGGRNGTGMGGRSTSSHGEPWWLAWRSDQFGKKKGRRGGTAMEMETWPVAKKMNREDEMEGSRQWGRWAWRRDGRGMPAMAEREAGGHGEEGSELIHADGGGVADGGSGRSSGQGRWRGQSVLAAAASSRQPWWDQWRKEGAALPTSVSSTWEGGLEVGDAHGVRQRGGSVLWVASWQLAAARRMAAGGIERRGGYEAAVSSRRCPWLLGQRWVAISGW